MAANHNTHTPTTLQHGFNLIEAAIVLGVVGLVVGGIWIAASTVQETLKLNETEKGLVQSIRKAQELIPATLGTTPYTDRTSTLIAAAAFPNNWINGSTVVTPLGTNLAIATTGGTLIQVDFNTANASQCYRLIPKLSATFRKEISQICTRPSSGSSWSCATAFPLASNTSLCNINESIRVAVQLGFLVTN